MTRFTVAAAKATLKKFDAELKYGSYGFGSLSNPKGCVVSIFLLHVLQDPVKVADTLSAAFQKWRESDKADPLLEFSYWAEVCDTTTNYLMALETGFERPTCTAHYGLSNEEGRLGHADGMALRKLVK